MGFPDHFLESLNGAPGFDKAEFTEAHQSPQDIFSIRFNTRKFNPENFEHQHWLARVPWSTAGYYLAERPQFVFDPLWHAGAYYVQEPSGMFLEFALRHSVDTSEKLRVLDLCAAPGGKSTLLQSMLPESSVIVSNEVIKARASILRENIVKAGGHNVVVTNNDPQDFGRLDGFFDAIVVDAPCSGSGLFRKDPAAMIEWSPQAVNMCSLRQQRILNDVLPSLRTAGVLIYCTCSFSREENEEIVEWLLKNFDMDLIDLPVPQEWGIVESRPGYRFYPNRLKGEGFFLAALRLRGDKPQRVSRGRKQSIQTASRSEKEQLKAEWLKGSVSLYKFANRLFAFTPDADEELSEILNHFFVRHAGVVIGEFAGKELVPDHNLAMSGLTRDELPSILLKKQEALQYLRKEEVKIDTAFKGWSLVVFNDVPLGWIKILSNRINNYYPKEWRILKQ
jgi:16S rRNA C967 or C1407 C5-methylase (RsmB/RsmF family)/NOL1/NOP2/fmu family ribosome biogenesis protein